MNKEDLIEQVKLLFEVMNDASVIASITDMTWNIYTKLKEKGFTDNEALQLTIALAQQKGK